MASKTAAFSEQSMYQTIAKSIRIPNAHAIEVVEAVTNLRRQAERYELSRDVVADEVRHAFSDESELELDAEKLSALATLISAPSEQNLWEKAEELRFAEAPHLVSCRTICDVRPLFGTEKASVEGALIVTLLQLDTHSSGSDGYKRITLQLRESDISELEEKLAEARKKVSTLKENLGGVLEFFE